MTREIVTINVGQAGIQLGSTIWEQYCLQCNINPDGYRSTTSNDYESNELIQSFYHETDEGKFIPRNLMVDLEPDIIDVVKQYKYRNILDPDFLLSGKEDAAGNFARGHFTVGKEMIDHVTDALRKLTEKCGRFAGFMFNNSVGGGTGSGLGSLIMETVATNYSKKDKIGMPIYPFDNNYSNNYVEPYNALLSTSWLLDYNELTLLFDNRKLWNMCRNKLFIEKPSYFDMNCIITKMILSFATWLHEIYNKYGMNEIFRKIAPLSQTRLHFLISSIALLYGKQATQKNKKLLVDGFVRKRYYYVNSLPMDYKIPIPLYEDVMNIIYAMYDTEQFRNCPVDMDAINNTVCNPEHLSIDCPDWDVEEDQYEALHLNYCGDMDSKEVGKSYQYIKHYYNEPQIVRFVETGWAIHRSRGFVRNEKVALSLENDAIAECPRNAFMIGNNSYTYLKFFKNRICTVYDKMYSQRAFVHWYVYEGMEEGEFAEARENLYFLEKDYRDIDCRYSETVTEEEEDSD